MDDKKKEVRPHVGIYFRCCRVYGYVYLNKARTAFVGWCPKCAAKIEMRVSPTGSTSKFFFAD